MAKNKRNAYDAPYSGLFGDTNQIRVIRQIIADPFGSYKPKELEALIEASAPSVRGVLKNLTRIGLLIKDVRDRQHPVYRVDVDSPIYLALNFLAFAIPDHKNSTHYMNDVIADYYDSELREQYESCDLVIGNHSDKIINSDFDQKASDAYLKRSNVLREKIPIPYARELEIYKSGPEYINNPHVTQRQMLQSEAAA
jgi:hypothetical protein